MEMSFIERTKTFYTETMAKGDPRVTTWMLMETPGPILCIWALYTVMVRQGPKWMNNKKPFELKSVLVAYNLGMVVVSVYMFLEFLVTAVLAGYSIRCQPVDYSNEPNAIRMANVIWWYFFSKIVELADTVFFILRKKNNQISFLHVYHHSITLFISWLGVKYVAGGQSFFAPMVNCFVHIWMYAYYGLAAIGPEMQKYLWWKKYITKLQLTQFAIVITHTIYNIIIDCSFPLFFNTIGLLHILSLVILFTNFYIKAYVHKEKAQ